MTLYIAVVAMIPSASDSHGEGGEARRPDEGPSAEAHVLTQLVQPLQHDDASEQ